MIELFIIFGGGYALYTVGMAIAAQLDYREVNKKMRRRLVTIGFLLTLVWGILIGLPTVARADIPVLYVQVPQWTDDWAVCAVDVPDAQCHWYVQQADNTFGEGFDWENAPWFDVNGLNDVPAIQASTAVQKLQQK